MSLRVTSSGGCSAALLWVMAAGWSAAVVFFALLVARGESAATAGAWAALALFGLVGLFLLALAIRKSVNVARFRGASIDLQTNPGVLGGQLAGVIHLPLPSWVARWYLIVLVLAAGASLAAGYVYREDAAAMYAMAVIGVVVLSAIALPTLAMTVRRIAADCTGLTLHYALLRGPKRIPAAPLRDVGAVYANGALHYELTFVGAEKAASWTIVTLRSHPEAEWVAYELRRALPQRA